MDQKSGVHLDLTKVDDLAVHWRNHLMILHWGTSECISTLPQVQSHQHQCTPCAVISADASLMDTSLLYNLRQYNCTRRYWYIHWDCIKHSAPWFQFVHLLIGIAAVTEGTVISALLHSPSRLDCYVFVFVFLYLYFDNVVLGCTWMLSKAFLFYKT